jgi:hypothetical protein
LYDCVVMHRARQQFLTILCCRDVTRVWGQRLVLRRLLS